VLTPADGDGPSSSRWGKILGLGAAFLAAWIVYSGSTFMATFEMLGPPVRNDQHGWLGPTPRGSECVLDIGKVNEWTCADTSVFERHRFGCSIWLALNGLG
jgi:hypothetical protein